MSPLSPYNGEASFGAETSEGSALCTNMYAGIQKVNPLSINPVYIQDKNLVITAPADGLAPKGARPSAGTVVTENYTCFLASFTGFQWSCETFIYWWHNLKWLLISCKVSLHFKCKWVLSIIYDIMWTSDNGEWSLLEVPKPPMRWSLIDWLFDLHGEIT